MHGVNILSKWISKHVELFVRTMVPIEGGSGVALVLLFVVEGAPQGLCLVWIFPTVFLGPCWTSETAMLMSLADLYISLYAAIVSTLIMSLMFQFSCHCETVFA